MATETLQFEKQTVEAAEQALKKAQQDFREKLSAYQEAAKEHYVTANAYKQRRKSYLL